MVSPESYFSQDMFLLHWNVGGSVGTTLLQARAESAREDGRLASLAVCHHRERLSGESVKTCEQPEPNLCISHLFCVSFGLFHVTVRTVTPGERARNVPGPSADRALVWDPNHAKHDK